MLANSEEVHQLIIRDILSIHQESTVYNLCHNIRLNIDLQFYQQSVVELLSTQAALTGSSVLIQKVGKEQVRLSQGVLDALDNNTFDSKQNLFNEVLFLEGLHGCDLASCTHIAHVPHEALAVLFGIGEISVTYLWEDLD